MGRLALIPVSWGPCHHPLDMQLSITVGYQSWEGRGGVALGSCAEACPSLILQASLLPLASISNEFLIKNVPALLP